MVLIHHVSDLHFGAEDRAALDWFAAQVARDRPDAVIVTGDLTMRARHHEFAAASAWLAALGVPVLIEAGNHDLPYFNPAARFLRPYARLRAVTDALVRPIALPGIALVSLMTTARAQWRLNWSKGHVATARLGQAVAALGASEAPHRLVLCHHPLIEAGTHGSARTRGGAPALAALARAGATAVLSGHVHDPFDKSVEIAGRTVRMIGAGTLSERVRTDPPGYNMIRFDGADMVVAARRAV